MAFIVDDILRVPAKLLRRVVTVKKGSRQMLLGSETTDGPASKARREKDSSRRYRIGEDLVWPQTLAILDNTVLAPLKLIRWVVNKVRHQADSEITNECGSTDQSASRTRRGED
jgi:hypothetical protein